MSLVIDSGYTTTFADPDVQAYLTAVETADNQALEYPVAYAINSFVLGCKADGIWPAIKASCILAGARTLSGALVPLVNASGTAPTLNGTLGDWNYNRKTGLKGNGTNNFIDSGRNENADPTSNAHFSIYPTEIGGLSSGFIGTSYSAGQSLCGAYYTSNAVGNTTGTYIRIRSSLVPPDYSDSVAGVAQANKLIGASRLSSSSLTRRYNGNSASANITELVPRAVRYHVLSENGGSFSTHRAAFYSIGEALNLALLDGRVTDLMTALAAAIP